MQHSPLGSTSHHSWPISASFASVTTSAVHFPTPEQNHQTPSRPSTSEFKACLPGLQSRLHTPSTLPGLSEDLGNLASLVLAVPCALDTFLWVFALLGLLIIQVPGPKGNQACSLVCNLKSILNSAYKVITSFISTDYKICVGEILFPLLSARQRWLGDCCLHTSRAC